MSFLITKESPVGSDLALLFARHTAAMHTDTPPESIHMMDASGLAVPEVCFFVMREKGVPVAMGAFKRFDGDHAEIKSMHVLTEQRGRGLSRLMLSHLVAEAKAAGIVRLCLETGSQDMFRPARILYDRAGFTECPPFGDYVLDPMSIFMTHTLA
ncbi:MAG: GNAT family N-acetyltransferase [Cypionkella sp.]